MFSSTYLIHPKCNVSHSVNPKGIITDKKRTGTYEIFSAKNYDKNSICELANNIY